MHGGLTPIKHGLYSKYIRLPLKQKAEEILKDKEKLLDLTREIARIKAILSQFDDNDSMEISPDLLSSLFQATEVVRRLIETKHKMEYGEKHIITLKEVHLVIEQVVQVIEQEVSDSKVRRRIARRFEDIGDGHEMDF